MPFPVLLTNQDVGAYAVNLGLPKHWCEPTYTYSLGGTSVVYQYTDIELGPRVVKITDGKLPDPEYDKAKTLFGFYNKPEPTILASKENTHVALNMPWMGFDLPTMAYMMKHPWYSYLDEAFTGFSKEQNQRLLSGLLEDAAQLIKRHNLWHSDCFLSAYTQPVNVQFHPEDFRLYYIDPIALSPFNGPYLQENSLAHQSNLANIGEWLTRTLLKTKVV